MVRAHYVDYVDVTYAEKTAETVLSLNADFSSGIPSSTFPVNFYFGPDIKIFRNIRFACPIYVVPGLVLFLKDFAHFTW